MKTAFFTALLFVDFCTQQPPVLGKIRKTDKNKPKTIKKCHILICNILKFNHGDP